MKNAAMTMVKAQACAVLIAGLVLKQSSFGYKASVQSNLNELMAVMQFVNIQ